MKRVIINNPELQSHLMCGYPNRTPDYFGCDLFYFAAGRRWLRGKAQVRNEIVHLQATI